MGGKSRKTGGVSKALIDRIKSGNIHPNSKDNKKGCDTPKGCGTRRKGNGLGISKKD